MPGHKLLIVEDDKKMREALHQIMRNEGYIVESAQSGEEALRRVKEKGFDMVLSDIKLPGIDGIEVLKAVRKYKPDISVVLITAYGTVDSAVRAMKEGAEDYVTKPFDMEEICLVVKKVIEKRNLVTRNIILESQLKKKYEFENIIGRCEAMVEVFKIIKKVKDSKSTVLIQGETGTGKELVARAIHYNSTRAGSLLLPVNCAALTENLLESEMFGYVKGAFTGALKDKRGLFEAAEGGTVFLDEIGDISPGLQQVLLRVLEDGEIQPVGSAQRRKVDVRVIAATNKELEELTLQGRFREDLYYRLAVITIQLPPLRRRREDIALLAQHFLKKHVTQNRKRIHGISKEAMTLLEEYEWPGNIRELDNTIERATLLEGADEITPGSLPLKIREYKPESSHEEKRSDQKTLEEVGRAHIIEVLEKTGGNKTNASEILGINRTSLWRMMRRLGIE
jgi:DNA-binding NtrC family response regulator